MSEFQCFGWVIGEIALPVIGAFIVGLACYCLGREHGVKYGK